MQRQFPYLVIIQPVVLQGGDVIALRFLLAVQREGQAVDVCLADNEALAGFVIRQDGKVEGLFGTGDEACWTLKSLTVMITSSSMLISLCRAEVFTTFRLFLAMLYLPFLTPQSTSGMETLTDTISCCMGCLYASPNFSAPG